MAWPFRCILSKSAHRCLGSQGQVFRSASLATTDEHTLCYFFLILLLLYSCFLHHMTALSGTIGLFTVQIKVPAFIWFISIAWSFLLIPSKFSACKKLWLKISRFSLHVTCYVANLSYSFSSHTWPSTHCLPLLVPHSVSLYEKHLILFPFLIASLLPVGVFWDDWTSVQYSKYKSKDLHSYPIVFYIPPFLIIFNIPLALQMPLSNDLRFWDTTVSFTKRGFCTESWLCFSL